MQVWRSNGGSPHLYASHMYTCIRGCVRTNILVKVKSCKGDNKDTVPRTQNRHTSASCAWRFRAAPITDEQRSVKTKSANKINQGPNTHSWFPRGVCEKIIEALIIYYRKPRRSLANLITNTNFHIFLCQELKNGIQVRHVLGTSEPRPSEMSSAL